jgi:tripartite-type tricarboxylate transporter receptor subunit TctC
MTFSPSQDPDVTRIFPSNWRSTTMVILSLVASFSRTFSCFSALPITARIALALDYPARPVRIIVGFAPAGGTDIIGRPVGQWLSEQLGQQFVIENRPGAASNIGTEMVVNAPPDGYTLLVATFVNAVNATLYDKLNFNFIRDIAPVASIAREPFAIEVHPSVPVKTVPEFITYAKVGPAYRE